jgi:kynurenine 3-monooxygenase
MVARNPNKDNSHELLADALSRPDEKRTEQPDTRNYRARKGKQGKLRSSDDITRQETSRSPTPPITQTDPREPLSLNGKAQPAKTACIVGGGPGGLIVAKKLAERGFEVFVLEQGAPYDQTRRADERSFNLTIDGLGMHAAGRAKGLIYAAGRIINGRAIHRPNKPVFTHPYGHNWSDHFVAVSRHDLLRSLASCLSAEPWCRVLFNAKAKETNVQSGSLTWINLITGEETSKTFDLVVFADGVNGLGREIAAKRPGISINKQVDPVTYIKAEITPEAARKCGLPLDKINFWTGKGGVSIGVPNVDDSASVLIMGDLPGSFTSPVFTSTTDAIKFMQARNPLLIEAIPDLAEQLVGRTRGHFLTTATSNWRLGAKAVLLGDSGRCAPPWAGLGANSAISDAAALADAIDANPNFDTALTAYSNDRIAASEIIQRMIAEHGRLLNASLGSTTWMLLQKFQDLRERLFKHRTLYQQIAFDDGGLNRLIRGERN